MDLPIAPLRPRSLVASGAALVAVWIAAALFRILRLQPGAVDTGWDALATGMDVPALHAAASVLDVIGTGLPAAAMGLAAALWILAARGWRWGVLVAVATVVSELDVVGMKLLAMRARPDASFGVGTSFPSGHTANAALLATVLILLVPHLALRIPAALYVVAMAWSRTVLHAHWLTDVAAGLVVGVATAVLLHGAACLLIGRRERISRTAVRPALVEPRTAP